MRQGTLSFRRPEVIPIDDDEDDDFAAAESAPFGGIESAMFTQGVADDADDADGAIAPAAAAAAVPPPPGMPSAAADEGCEEDTLSPEGDPPAADEELPLPRRGALPARRGSRENESPPSAPLFRADSPEASGEIVLSDQSSDGETASERGMSPAILSATSGAPSPDFGAPSSAPLLDDAAALPIVQTASKPAADKPSHRAIFFEETDDEADAAKQTSVPETQEQLELPPPPPRDKGKEKVVDGAAEAGKAKEEDDDDAETQIPVPVTRPVTQVARRRKAAARLGIHIPSRARPPRDGDKDDEAGMLVVALDDPRGACAMAAIDDDGVDDVSDEESLVDRRRRKRRRVLDPQLASPVAVRYPMHLRALPVPELGVTPKQPRIRPRVVSVSRAASASPPAPVPKQTRRVTRRAPPATKGPFVFPPTTDEEDDFSDTAAPEPKRKVARTSNFFTLKARKLDVDRKQLRAVAGNDAATSRRASFSALVLEDDDDDDDDNADDGVKATTVLLPGEEEEIVIDDDDEEEEEEAKEEGGEGGGNASRQKTNGSAAKDLADMRKFCPLCNDMVLATDMDEHIDRLHSERPDTDGDAELAQRMQDEADEEEAERPTATPAGSKMRQRTLDGRVLATPSPSPERTPWTESKGKAKGKAKGKGKGKGKAKGKGKDSSKSGPKRLRSLSLDSFDSSSPDEREQRIATPSSSSSEDESTLPPADIVDLSDDSENAKERPKRARASSSRGSKESGQDVFDMLPNLATPHDARTFRRHMARDIGSGTTKKRRRGK